MALRRSRLLVLWLVLCACSRGSRSFPIGADPRSLPTLGAAPLMALVPSQVEAVLVVQDPASSLATLRATRLWQRLSAEGLFQDSLALPPIERWRAMQAKLSELARTQLPGPEALLSCPALLAWMPRSSGHAGGFLYVARINPAATRAWSLARALNAVRPSGREVEIERIKGIPVREVSFGSGAWFPPGEQLTYAVLGDRLLLSTDEALLSQALLLGLEGDGRSLASRSPFSDLESRAQSVGFAAAWVPSGSERLAPGVRSAELDGRDLMLQLDAALWSESSARPVIDPGSSLLLGFSGLDLQAALAKVRPEIETPASALLLQKLDALAGSLGPGVFVQVVPSDRPERGISVVVDALRSAVPRSTADVDGQVTALAEAFLNHAQPAEPITGGMLHCSTEDAVCLASCAGAVRLAWPGSYLRERGCPAIKSGAPSDVVLAIGSRPPILVAELREGRGQLLFPEPK